MRKATCRSRFAFAICSANVKPKQGQLSRSNARDIETPPSGCVSSVAYNRLVQNACTSQKNVKLLVEWQITFVIVSCFQAGEQCIDEAQNFVCFAPKKFMQNSSDVRRFRSNSLCH